MSLRETRVVFKWIKYNDEYGYKKGLRETRVVFK